MNEQPAAAAPEPVAVPPPPPTELKPQTLVDINYPDPTPLSIVIRDVSRLVRQMLRHGAVGAAAGSSAISRAAHARAQRMPTTSFSPSLSVVNLRAVQIGGDREDRPTRSSWLFRHELGSNCAPLSLPPSFRSSRGLHADSERCSVQTTEEQQNRRASN